MCFSTKNKVKKIIYKKMQKSEEQRNKTWKNFLFKKTLGFEPIDEILKCSEFILYKFSIFNLLQNRHYKLLNEN